MSEELETTKEIAKAVQETGKAVQGVTKLVGNVGAWMSRVMGTVPEDVVALVAGDRLQALRLQKQLEHLDSIRRKEEEILRRRGIENPRPIGLKQAIPAFEAMADESDEALQDLWARLLANAMDPNRDVELRTDFIDVLHKFEGLDALVFKLHADMTDNARQTIKYMAKEQVLRITQVAMSVDHLVRIGCLQRVTGRVDLFKPTALGEELWLAVKDDADD